MRRVLLSLIVALALPASARAATLDPIGTFDDPVFVTSDPGDPDRLLVVEQGGTIELADHGVVKPFLDLTGANLVSSGGERGLAAPTRSGAMASGIPGASPSTG